MIGVEPLTGCGHNRRGRRCTGRCRKFGAWCRRRHCRVGSSGRRWSRWFEDRCWRRRRGPRWCGGDRLHQRDRSRSSQRRGRRTARSWSIGRSRHNGRGQCCGLLRLSCRGLRNVRSRLRRRRGSACVLDLTILALHDKLTRHHLPIPTEWRGLAVVERYEHRSRIANAQQHTLLRIEPHGLALREHAARVGFPVYRCPQPRRSACLHKQRER